MLINIHKGLLFTILLGHGALATSQTFDLVCLGSKSVTSISGKNFDLQNFKQTYTFRDGKIGGNSPEPINENMVVYTLSPSGDLSCKNFCSHKVILNNLTGEVIDTNYSVESGVQHNWEFKGICKPN
ncbi:MAG TPA: hypothetical protein DIT38_03315 [Burkholderiales bacterium]|nr:hypothetical protein [Pseudomonadota bacterium]HCO57175.1 hypothetical protein [Burkholderiales bacterium]